jgi:myo-inositol-1(or 4)-monophosphatase
MGNYTGLPDLRDQLIIIAKQCGDILTKMYDPRGVKVEVPKDCRDILIEADNESNNFLLGELKKYQFNIMSEEDLSTNQAGNNYIGMDSKLTWIIDPIDGTVNFSKGIPYFSISIALLHEEQGVLLGLVYNPITGDLFHSIGNNQSFNNNTLLNVNRNHELDKSIIAVSDGASDDTMIAKTLPAINLLFFEARSVRVWGAAQLDLCSVANGMSDGYVKMTPPQWDCLAGAFIAKNAGAYVSTSTGKDIDWIHNHNENIIVSNGLIHKDLIKCIQKAKSNDFSLSKIIKNFLAPFHAKTQQGA